MKKGVDFRLTSGFFLFMLLDIILLVSLLFGIKLSVKAFAVIMTAIGAVSFLGAVLLNKKYDACDNYDKQFLCIDIFLGCVFVKLFLEALKILR